MTLAEYNELLWYLDTELQKSQATIVNELEQFEQRYKDILSRYLSTTPPPTTNPPPTTTPPPSSGSTETILLNWGHPPVDTRGTSASIGTGSTTTVVGVLAVPLGVTTPLNQPGLISVVEYDGPPVERLMSLSTQRNDFRGYVPGMVMLPPSDPTGANAPLAWGGGMNPNIQFLLSGDTGFPAKLTPGQTYYVNLRTVFFSTGEPSCSTSSCNVRFTVNPPR